jgi:hypothetical protein
MNNYCADATAGLNRWIDVSTLDVTNLTVAESKFAIDALDPYKVLRFHLLAYLQPICRF